MTAAPSPHPAEPGPRRAVAGRALLSGLPVAMIEIVALLAALALVDRLWLGGEGFAGVHPHPFWAVVVLASVQYGAPAGVLAAAAAAVTARLIAGAPVAETGGFYAFAAAGALQPALWLATALVLGGLRSFARFRTEALRADLDQTRADALTLADALERSLREIDTLEARIAGETGSSAALLRGLSMLEAEPQEHAARLAAFAQTAAGPQARLFLATPHGLRPIAGDAPDLPAQAAAALERQMSVRLETHEGVSRMATALRHPRSGALLGALIGDIDDAEAHKRFELGAQALAAMLAARPAQAVTP